MNICIDIDGTITDAYCWLEMTNQYFGRTIKPFEVTVYDVYEVFNIPKEDYLDFYERFGEEMHGKAEIRGTAKEILWKLDKQHNIYYVTAREEKMKRVTEAWFANNELPRGELYLLGSHYKVEKAKELDCDIFIEDRYENAIELSQAGFQVLLIDCYYNQGPLISGVTRVFTWKDIDETIEAYASHRIRIAG
ncbi:MAG: hypothetical protein AB2421_01560 [Thermotaleaceae bacterium]